MQGKRKLEGLKKGRAWVEINTNHLKYNAKILMSHMPKGCKMMAVVKANAYGHGAVKVAKALNEIGVTSFAVATIDEGIELRKNHIRGEILVLGHTNLSRVGQLCKYGLMQTVIDYDYALDLSKQNKTPEVHIKIDTGMHRLGIDVDDFDRIYDIFMNKKLRIKGIFTHLCIADCLERDAIHFTEHQIESFYYLLRQLKDKQIELPRIHIQSSYGFLNYNELQCDYARIGIALYGSLSSDQDETRLAVKLLPVLTLKSRIVMIRAVLKGEGIGYGRDFCIEKDSKIAVIPLGYADGLPRNLTQGEASVLIHGIRVPMIGRICMDQLIIDVTDLADVRVGDVVTLIGVDGTQEIPAVTVAKNAGSITNELFSRLGARVERVYI